MFVVGFYDASSWCHPAHVATGPHHPPLGPHHPAIILSPSFFQPACRVIIHRCLSSAISPHHPAIIPSSSCSDSTPCHHPSARIILPSSRILLPPSHHHPAILPSARIILPARIGPYPSAAILWLRIGPYPSAAIPSSSCHRPASSCQHPVMESLWASS